MLKRTLVLAVALAAGTTMALAENSGKQDTTTGPARATPAPDTVTSGTTTPKGGSPKETGKASSDGAAKPDH